MSSLSFPLFLAVSSSCSSSVSSMLSVLSLSFPLLVSHLPDYGMSESSTTNDSGKSEKHKKNVSI